MKGQWALSLMQRNFFSTLILGTLLTPLTIMAEEVDIQKLLTVSDRSRGGIEKGISWNISLKTFEEGAESDREFSVKAKGNNAYVEAVAPARNKGEIYVFNDRSMWFFKPTLKKPVVISAREKMTGQAANGDIASTHYARDYTPTLVKTENENSDKVFVLHLKAKSPQVTYDQINYWISDKTKLGIRAEFLTLQGKPMKTAVFEYKNTILVDGRKTPFISKMVLVDAKFKNNRSIMTYLRPQPETLPDSLFNVNNMSR